MPAFVWNDFSGGMVTSVNELMQKNNSLINAQNVDVWSKIGAAKLIQNIVEKTAFPTGKVYDSHLMYPVQGDKDYVIFLMTDGTIYSYDGTTFSLITTVTAGSAMAYAGDKIYVFYRSMTAPTLANTVRKAISWDYFTSAFVVEDVMVDEDVSISDVQEISFGTNGPFNKNYTYKSVITSINKDGAESFGLVNIATGGNGQDYVIKVTKTANLNKLRLYCSITEDIGASASIFLPPGFICELDSTGGFIPFVGINFRTASGPAIRVYKIYSSVDVQGALTFLLDEYIAGRKYIDIGNKVKIAEIEYTISSITYVVASAGVAEYYSIVLTGTPNPPPAISTLQNDSDPFGVIEFEVKWISNVIYLPIQKRYYAILGTPVDENRPESKYTSGTGNVLAFAKNRLFTANPYFPDVFSTGEDEDKKGFIAWSYITGEGKIAASLIPDLNLLSTTITGTEIIDLVSFQDTLWLLQKNAISRLDFSGNGITFLQSDSFGVEKRLNYFVTEGKLFLFSNRKVYLFTVNNSNYQTGNFKPIELSRFIADKLTENQSLAETKLFYDDKNELLYLYDLNDLNGNFVNYICSLRNGEPVWVKYYNSGISILSGFKQEGKQYFIVKKSDGTYSIYEYEFNGVYDYGTGITHEYPVYITSNIIIEGKNEYPPEGNYYAIDAEILYRDANTSLNFDLIIDDVVVLTKQLESHPYHTKMKIKFPRSAKTRFKKIRWKIYGNAGGGNNFELYSVIINYGSYGSEAQRGY